MKGVITATYENGVFRPDRDLELTPGTKVRLIPAPWDGAIASEQDALAEWERLCDESPVVSTEAHLTRDQLHERLQSEWDNSFEQRRKAFEELEKFRLQNPINSAGQRLTRDQLHERR